MTFFLKLKISFLAPVDPKTVNGPSWVIWECCDYLWLKLQQLKRHKNFLLTTFTSDCFRLKYQRRMEHIPSFSYENYELESTWSNMSNITPAQLLFGNAVDLLTMCGHNLKIPMVSKHAWEVIHLQLFWILDIVRWN